MTKNTRNHSSDDPKWQMPGREEYNASGRCYARMSEEERRELWATIRKDSLEAAARRARKNLGLE